MRDFDGSVLCCNIKIKIKIKRPNSDKCPSPLRGEHSFAAKAAKAPPNAKEIFNCTIPSGWICKAHRLFWPIEVKRNPSEPRGPPECTPETPRGAPEVHPSPGKARPGASQGTPGGPQEGPRGCLRTPRNSSGNHMPTDSQHVLPTQAPSTNGAPIGMPRGRPRKAPADVQHPPRAPETSWGAA